MYFKWVAVYGAYDWQNLSNFIGATGFWCIPNTCNKIKVHQAEKYQNCKELPRKLMEWVSFHWFQKTVCLGDTPDTSNRKVSCMCASGKIIISRTIARDSPRAEKKEPHKRGYNRIWVMTWTSSMLHQKTLKFTACTSCSFFSEQNMSQITHFKCISVESFQACWNIISTFLKWKYYIYRQRDY